jgi:two-component system, NarL family, nitrate/nitrite response regulator NarL
LRGRNFEVAREQRQPAALLSFFSAVRSSRRVEEDVVQELSAVRVLAVDDSAPFRRFVIERLQERSASVVGIAVDGLEAVHKARILQPDLVLMDIWLPTLNGLEATREICRFSPASKIIVISNNLDPAVVQAAFDAGANGYVLKSLAAAELLAAVETVLRGETFVGGGLRGFLADKSRGDA